MDYEKLPKIDIAKVDKKDLHRIFHTDINVYKISDTTKDNVIMVHSILIDEKPYITGKSQLLVFNDEKRIFWEHFYPFSHVKQQSEILSENMNVSDLTHNAEIYKNTIDKNPEILKGYNIISKTIDKKIEPIALIKNYWRQGLGTIANFRILENIINKYDSKILDYKIRHVQVSPYRKEQLSKMGILSFADNNPLIKVLGIDTEETVKDYYIKSGQYAIKKDLL